MTKNDLYGWIFTYNPETGNWRACTRDRYNDLFSIPEENFPRSKDLLTIQELVMKYEGEEDVLMGLLV